MLNGNFPLGLGLSKGPRNSSLAPSKYVFWAIGIGLVGVFFQDPIQVEIWQLC